LSIVDLQLSNREILIRILVIVVIRRRAFAVESNSSAKRIRPRIDIPFLSALLEREKQLQRRSLDYERCLDYESAICPERDPSTSAIYLETFRDRGNEFGTRGTRWKNRCWNKRPTIIHSGFRAGERGNTRNKLIPPCHVDSRASSSPLLTIYSHIFPSRRGLRLLDGLFPFFYAFYAALALTPPALRKIKFALIPPLPPREGTNPPRLAETSIPIYSYISWYYIQAS
jgi:hypothetical protein